MKIHRIASISFEEPVEYAFNIHAKINNVDIETSKITKDGKNIEFFLVTASICTQELIILNQNYKRLSGFVDFAYETFPSAWVSLHGLIMRGQAKINKDFVVARFRDIKTFVEDALDTAIANNKNWGVLMIHYCTIDLYYWKYLLIN